MTRKKSLLMLALVVLIFLAIGGTLLALVHHEPAFYRRNVIESGRERQALSMTFFGQFAKLAANFKDPESDKELPWTFSEAQINSYLAEDFIRLGDGENLKKRGITDPRLSIEKDRMRLAFRYTNSLVSTVVSVDMRVWLVPKETNLIAVKILNHKVGALPISLQSLREEITDMAGKQNIEVTWYRHEGLPVALLRVQTKDRPRPNAKFVRLALSPGTLSLGLISLEPLPPNVQNQKLLAPLAN